MARIIEKIKNEAIGRCRERIEMASHRAKVLMAEEKNRPPIDKEYHTAEDHGMTSAFKRRHGL